MSSNVARPRPQPYPASAARPSISQRMKCASGRSRPARCRARSPRYVSRCAPIAVTRTGSGTRRSTASTTPRGRDEWPLSGASKQPSGRASALHGGLARTAASQHPILRTQGRLWAAFDNAAPPTRRAVRYAMRRRSSPFRPAAHMQSPSTVRSRGRGGPRRSTGISERGCRSRWRRSSSRIARSRDDRPADCGPCRGGR